NPVNASLATAQGTGTILNDDALPALSVLDVSVLEGDSGTTNAAFTVSLSAASGRSITVSYSTADGTASAATDYQSTSGTLTFAPGMTSQAIMAAVRGCA